MIKIYTFNKNYFDVIDSEDKAYWIGFIWCDGYLYHRIRKKSDTYEFKLSLSTRDIKHLELLKFYLDSDHVIREYEIKSGFNTKYKEARLLICNKYFGETLHKNYGLIPKRHETNKVINNIPYEFRYHFIRGILDAEGSIIKRNIEYKRTSAVEYSLSFTTYEELLIYINNVFIQDGLTNTEYKLSKRHEEGDEYCKSLRITGNSVVRTILTKIYSCSNNLRLERKYEKYIDLLEYIKKKGDM